MKPASVVHERHLCTAMSTGNSVPAKETRGECGHQRQATITRVFNSTGGKFVGFSRATPPALEMDRVPGRSG